MRVVLNHYENYMTSLSIRKLYDDSGNAYYGVDEDVHNRLKAKLMRAVLSFKIDAMEA